MEKLFDLTGKKAIITGGGAGLGRAMTEALLEYGAEVVVVGRGKRTRSAVAELQAKGRIFGVYGELGEHQDRLRIFDEALAKLGTVDILVNNAGIQIRHKSEEFPLEDWQRVLDINLTAVFELCQLAGRVMLAKGYGKIINIASVQSFIGGLTIPAYAASKGGVAQLTKTLANEWAGRGVNVNALAPGYMDTEMTAAIKGDPVRYKSILERIPAGRWGQPEDLQGTLIFLASRASDYLHGVILPVDGGMLGR